MKQNYDFFIKEVLKSEGGYSNDPNDKGGPTNFGITIADYKKYINKAGTAEDVKNMTVDQAKAIYKTRYWDAVNGDTLASGLDYTVADYGVNSGVGRANSVLAQFKDKSTIDQINGINDERLHFLHNIRNGSDWMHFGRGWQSRVDRVRKDSLALANPKSSAPAATAATATVVVGTATIAATPVHHWAWLIPTILITAFVAFIAVEWIEFRRQEKQNG